MAVTVPSDLKYDPYDQQVARNPWGIFRRMRDEAPLYYDEEREFYALTRFADVEWAHVTRDTFISGHGGTLDLLRAKIELPPGTLIFEDPPTHTIHRKLLSRVFTPRRIAELEPQIRGLCVEMMDPLVGSGGFDWINDFGKDVPTTMIGMLLGIPAEDHRAVREFFERQRREGHSDDVLSGGIFARYVDERIQHPSDDIMSQLLHAEFENEHGELVHLTREELLAYVNIIAAAGNDTTKLLIGWTGRLLSDHPDQRQLLVEDPSRIPGALEEILRYEPPPLQTCRYVARDVEIHGEAVPEGSTVALVIASANRDERHVADPDRFDVLREPTQQFTFGFGAHYCLGQALARLSGRIVLEEVLQRWPEWELDESGAVFLAEGCDLRGWDALPCTVA